MPHEHDDELRFHPTSGRGTGILAVVGTLAVVVTTLAHPSGTPAWVAPASALLGVLAWASLLWPRLSVDADDLVLRNMLETVRVPLAAIEGVVVRQFLVVWAGGNRYVSPAVGRSRRMSTPRLTPGLPTAARMRGTISLGRTNKPTILPGSHQRGEGVSYVDYIEQEIKLRVDLARRGEEGSGATVRREPAWLPIGLLVASVLALLVSILL